VKSAPRSRLEPRQERQRLDTAGPAHFLRRPQARTERGPLRLAEKRMAKTLHELHAGNACGLWLGLGFNSVFAADTTAPSIPDALTRTRSLIFRLQGVFGIGERAVQWLVGSGRGLPKGSARHLDHDRSEPTHIYGRIERVAWATVWQNPIGDNGSLPAAPRVHSLNDPPSFGIHRPTSVKETH
jgi:hypothetical protein